MKPARPDWYDVHCHIDHPPLSGNLDGFLLRAVSAGVTRLLVPGVNGSPLIMPVRPELKYAWGIHPGYAAEWTEKSIEEEFARSGFSPAAIGECGLDNRIGVDLQLQRNLFERQLRIASSCGIPVIVHLRGLWNEALQMLKTHARDVPWVMHSFCGSFEVARSFLDEGAWISLSGVVCRKKAVNIRKLALAVPISRMLIETDSPYIRPGFCMLRHSEPAMMNGVGHFIARLRGLNVLELARVVMENSLKLFDDKLEVKSP